MALVFQNSMFLIKHTKKFLIAAVVIFVVSIGITATLGLQLGIDFTGGSLTEVSYDARPAKTSVENAVRAFDPDVELGGFSLRESVSDGGREGYILRTRDLSEEERIKMEVALVHEGGGAEIERFTSIGPVIGDELRRKAIWAIAAVVIVIILFVAFAFRKVSKPVGSWVYGGITILALFHDVLVPTAFMSVLGYITGAEIDVLFVMALLAVLGYSVNDTIVVFDRVRENLLKNKSKDRHEPFDVVVGRSVQQTLTRSINTSVTTSLALGALYFLGGAVTQNFALVLLVGVIAGTYSSICVANPLLIYFGTKKKSKKS